jgi:hypothetical protein
VIFLDKQKRNKSFLNFLILVVSIVIVVLLCIFLLDTTGKINQGSFRVSDLVIFSIADVKDTEGQNNDAVPNQQNNTTDETKKPITSLSDLRLDVSQKNTISFLIAKSNEVESSEIYIDNVKIKFPLTGENIYIYQNEENKVDLKTENIRLVLNKEDKDGQYLIKFNIDNINCVKDAVIPQTQNSITFDGTIFSILNTKISDITFNVQFNLNILDSTGKLNICKVNVNLPNELLITHGLSIVKEDIRNFPFRIK